MSSVELKTRIDADLKTAMLSGDKTLTTTLRGLKGALLNAEIEVGKRQEGLADSEATAVLRKEAKKRKESAELFHRGGNQVKADAELAELEVIEKYLPEMMSDEAVAKAVHAAIEQTGASSLQDMGKVVGLVKNQLGDKADGSVIARLTKEKLR